MENRTEMFEKLIKGLQNIYGNMLVSILLYGSVARETNTEDSDVDIDLEQFVKWEDVLPFYRNVKREGVVLWKVA